MDKALQSLGYFFAWLDPKDGWLPWFEHNQGMLSVMALALTASALWWEFRQARRAERDAAKARSETETKDRQALLTSRKKEREDRVARERDEITGYCFTVKQTFEALQRAARVELAALAVVQPGGHVTSAAFIAEGWRVKRAVEALMLRPPSDKDAILATCEGLDIFANWSNLEVLFEPDNMITAIRSNMDKLAVAQAKLDEAHQSAVNWANEQIIRIYEED
ncbi:hypothetical protein [Caulobacter sp. LARHSG274]